VLPKTELFIATISKSPVTVDWHDRPAALV
jgi:hypothetical protein